MIRIAKLGYNVEVSYYPIANKLNNLSEHTIIYTNSASNRTVIRFKNLTKIDQTTVTTTSFVINSHIGPITNQPYILTSITNTHFYYQINIISCY